MTSITSSATNVSKLILGSNNMLVRQAFWHQYTLKRLSTLLSLQKLPYQQVVQRMATLRSGKHPTATRMVPQTHRYLSRLQLSARSPKILAVHYPASLKILPPQHFQSQSTQQPAK